MQPRAPGTRYATQGDMPCGLPARRDVQASLFVSAVGKLRSEHHKLCLSQAYLDVTDQVRSRLIAALARAAVTAGRALTFQQAAGAEYSLSETCSVRIRVWARG